MSLFEKKGWYRVAVPEGWEVDSDEEPPAIYRPEGVGALHLTAQAPRPLKPGERIDVFLMLRAYLNQTGVDLHAIPSRRWSERGVDWASCDYTGDNAEGETLFWRVWMATNHDVLVFLTYACREEDKDVERDAVDRIVSSLELT